MKKIDISLEEEVRQQGRQKVRQSAVRLSVMLSDIGSQGKSQTGGRKERSQTVGGEVG